VNKEALTKKAEDNKYRGELKAIKSKKSGKVIVIYQDGLTKLQKIASGTGAMTRGESVEVSESEEMEMDMEAEGEDEDEEAEMHNEMDEYEEMDCDEYEMGMEDEDAEMEMEEFDFEDEEDLSDVMERYNELNEKKDLAQAQADLEKQMDEYEEKNFVVNRESLLKKAKDNKFRGNLRPVKSRKSGKVVVIYQDGLTKLQKLGQSAGGYNRSRGMGI
jgi:flagellar hook protein FlgE